MFLIVLAGEVFFVLPELYLFGLFVPLILSVDNRLYAAAVESVDDISIFIVLIQALRAAGVGKHLLDTGIELLQGRFEIGRIQFVQRIQRISGIVAVAHAFVVPRLVVITFYLVDSIFCRSHQALLCSLELAAPS
ncbi:hypothetical protein B0T36_13165 [Nocardia donostiensis]|nr:hypothetical protein B0T36_13165 [Nocardia donostiensis]